MKEAGIAKRDASRRHAKKIKMLMKAIKKENSPSKDEEDHDDDNRLESERKRFEKQLKRIDEDLKKTLDENEDLRVGTALGSPACLEQQEAAVTELSAFAELKALE